MRQLFFIGGKFKREMSVLKKLGEKIKAEIRERAGESNSMEQMSREELIEGCRKQLRESFDPKENMIVTDYKHWVGGYHTRRTGITHVVRSTAEYASGVLLLSIKDEYEQAYGALWKLCSLQDRREGSATYGLWPYYLEEDLAHMLVPDYNWSDFIGKELIGICLCCREALPEELYEALKQAVRAAMECSIRRNVAADYTNMSIMSCMTLLSAGELLKEERFLKEGRARLAKLMEYTEFNGAFSEYNSSAYILVALHEINRMRTFLKDPESLSKAEKLNWYAWKMLGEHYNCEIGQLTPPQARAYRDLENGSLAFTIWNGTGGHYGAPATEKTLEAGGVSLEELCFPSHCPEELLSLFAQEERFLKDTYYRTNRIRIKGEDTTIIRELDSPDLTAYSWQTKDYSMGSFAFCDTWNQRRNCMVVWDKEHPKYFRLRCINGDYDFCSGIVSACQDHNKLLGQLGFVSDRGSFHYILDQRKDGIYETEALYFCFELGGETKGLKIKQDGKDFLIEDGSLQIRLTIEKWVYDGKEASVMVSEDGSRVILQGYQGEKKLLDTNKLGDTYGVFAMEVITAMKNQAEGESSGKRDSREEKGLATKNTKENEPEKIQIRFRSSRVESSLGGMKVSSYRYTVPYRKALGLDGVPAEEISDKIQKILAQMQHMEGDGTVQEECPISIISMEAWEWPQGVALFAMYQYYKENGDESIKAYLLDWFDRQLGKGLPAQNINTTCPMLTLACLYEETQDEKYLPVLKEWCRGVMECLPRTEEEGLQHIVSGVQNEGQLWDDTLYMAVLFLAKMGVVLHKEAYIQESIRQFMIHLKYLTDCKTGLFFHGWTFLGKHHFAGALWGRGNSWYTAGLVDYLECLEGNEGVKAALLSALNRQVEALAACQDESGLWHTLLDDECSYLETSASSAFAYGILKAVRKGYLPARYAAVGEKALKGVLSRISEEGVVGGVSYGTPVFATLQEYREVPICPMPYGQSMALMMLVEALKQKTKENGGRTVKEAAILQEAIDACARDGGGRVTVAPGIYVTGTLELKSHVELHLEKGAVLLGSTKIEDYPENATCFEDAVGHKRGRALLYAYRAEDISITGEGVIDGRGGEFGEERPDHLIRPFLVRLVECKGIKVENVTLKQSAAWCLHIQDSEQVTVRNITIESRCNGNNDGIDIDGCKQVEIADCEIDSGDDALCLKATSTSSCEHIRIHGCKVTSRWAAFKIGTESVGDFRDIEVWDCCFYDVKGCAIKVVPVDGGNVKGLYLHDMQLVDCTGPVFFSTGRRLRTYFGVGREKPGSIRQVKLARIYGNAVSTEGGFYQGKPWGNAKGCIVFSGLEELPIEDVCIEDCVLQMPGGITEYPEGTKGKVPEMGEQYPEFHLFDPLPCYGMYLRHVKGVQVKGLTLTAEKEDVRAKIVKEDVTDVSEG